MSDAGQVNIQILGKEYQVACSADESKAVKNSAELLNSKLKDIRDSGKVVGLDRMAVMAGLNLAHDLLNEQDGPGRVDETMTMKLRLLRERVERALENGKQLEL